MRALLMSLYLLIAIAIIVMFSAVDFKGIRLQKDADINSQVFGK